MKSSNLRVTIITISLNARDLIASTIDSVLAQDYAEIEYIVLDGASSDGTQDVIAGYGDKITCFVSEPDKGISDAWNKALNMATGDVIGLLNAGDEYATNAVSEAVRAINAGADFVYGDTELVDEDGKVLRYNRGRFHLWWYSAGLGFYHPSCFARRSLYQKVGVFNEKVRYAMDSDWILKCLKSGARISHSGVCVRMVDGGVSVTNRFVALGEHFQAIENAGFGRVAVYMSMLMTALRGLVRARISRK